MNRDQIRGFVLNVLLGALHEHKGAVGGHLVLAFLGDEPTLLLSVSDVAVISRYCLQLNLDLSLHGAAD